MTENLFKPGNVEDDNTDYLALVKDKYGDDTKAWAKAMIHKDRHIEKIETEQEGLRSDLSQRIKMEELLAEIKANRNSQSMEHNQGSEMEQPSVNQNPGLKAEDVERIASDVLSKKQQKELALKNESFAINELTKAWGPNYVDRLVRECQNNGMSQDQAILMAQNNPQLFLKVMVGSTSPNQAPTYMAPPKGQSGFVSSGNQTRNEDYYDKLRKENPEVYWDRKTQRQRWDDAYKQGESFFTKS